MPRAPSITNMRWHQANVSTTPLLLLLIIATALTIACMPATPATAQLQVPPAETVAALRRLLAADMPGFNRRVAQLAGEMTSVTKSPGAFDELVSSIAASTSRAKQDEAVAAVLPGFSKTAADALEAGPKSFLALALIARARKPIRADQLNELVFALATKGKVQELSAFEEATLREIIAWRKEGFAVVDGKIVSAGAARTATVAKAELDADTIKRMEELLPIQMKADMDRTEFAVDKSRLGFFDTWLSEAFRRSSAIDPPAGVYETRLNVIARLMQDAKHMSDHEAEAFARVLYGIHTKSLERGIALNMGEVKILEVAPTFFKLRDIANAESRAFLKSVQVDARVSAGVGRSSVAVDKWRAIDVPSQTMTVLGDKARHKLDQAIEAASRQARSRMRPPRTYGFREAPPADAFRVWAKSKDTVNDEIVDAFKSYKGAIPLERETSAIAYTTSNYELLHAAYMRSGKPVSIDDMETIALAINVKVERHGGVLTAADKDFLKAYADLVGSIGKTRYVWRDGMVLSVSESKDLYQMAKALHDGKFKTIEAFDNSLNSVQRGMMRELRSYESSRIITRPYDFEEVMRRSGSTPPSLTSVILSDRALLNQREQAARAADAATPPLTRLKNWITGGQL